MFVSSRTGLVSISLARLEILSLKWFNAVLYFYSFHFKLINLEVHIHMNSESLYLYFRILIHLFILPINSEPLSNKNNTKTNSKLKEIWIFLRQALIVLCLLFICNCIIFVGLFSLCHNCNVYSFALFCNRQGRVGFLDEPFMFRSFWNSQWASLTWMCTIDKGSVLEKIVKPSMASLSILHFEMLQS